MHCFHVYLSGKKCPAAFVELRLTSSVSLCRCSSSLLCRRAEWLSKLKRLLSNHFKLILMKPLRWQTLWNSLGKMSHITNPHIGEKQFPTHVMYASQKCISKVKRSSAWRYINFIVLCFLHLYSRNHIFQDSKNLNFWAPRVFFWTISSMWSRNPRGQKQENSAWGKISRLAGKTSSNEVCLKNGNIVKIMRAWKVMIVLRSTFCTKKNETELKYEKVSKWMDVESCPPPIVNWIWDRPPKGLGKNMLSKVKSWNLFYKWKGAKKEGVCKVLLSLIAVTTIGSRWAVP